MIINSKKGFDTNKNELVWTKIIRIKPYYSLKDECTHVVKYYKTEAGEEYYLFDYIMADNNRGIVNNFNGHHWNEIVKQIDFTDSSLIYSQDVSNKKHYDLVTRGNFIRKNIEECLHEEK